MAGEILIRRISLAGWAFDTDWTDPANVRPDNVRRLKFASSTVLFALVGKASGADDALDVDIGTLTVDAWLGLEVGGQVRRGGSIIESRGSELNARILLKANDAVPGRYGYFNIASLTNVGALASLWVYILSGARPV
jgi:hypothetical protein